MPRRCAFRFLALLAMVAATAGLPSPAAAEPAVTPENRPKPVAGFENGRLPDSELVWVAAGCRAHRSSAPSMSTLLKAANASGVPLANEECYRSIDGQVAVQKKYSSRPDCVANTRTDASGRPIGTSMHGWGKASDFEQTGATLTFQSAGYKWLFDNAARFGWNHPSWARPGGSSCPEPWHWEFVGDGGNRNGDPVPADTVAVLPTASAKGHSTVTGLGAVRHTGDAVDAGSMGDRPINWVVVGGARAAGGGYWLVGADGGIFAFGTAKFLGSTGSLRLNKPIVGMAAAPDGNGYWLVASDGGVFSFGSAAFFGSMGGTKLNRPVVGMAAAPDGKGYWLVAGDGGIFAFGSARFHGSTGSIRLNEPIMGMAPSRTGQGYWFVGSDGGVFSFGDATFAGSALRERSQAPAVGLGVSPAQSHYSVVYADGVVTTFGAVPSNVVS